MRFSNVFHREPDRTWRNNDSDGQTFYGFDDGEGYTDWYDRYGNLDTSTTTPTEEEQDQNDAGY